MLGPALQQLLSDLSEAGDRSPYEEAIYHELVAVKVSLSDLGLATGVSGATHAEGRVAGMSTDSNTGTGAGIGSYGRSPGSTAVGSSGESRTYTQVDLGPKDIKRLRCGKSDCPNKRL
jgi:hypothetical protein